LKGSPWRPGEKGRSDQAAGVAAPNLTGNRENKKDLKANKRRGKKMGGKLLVAVGRTTAFALQELSKRNARSR